MYDDPGEDPYPVGSAVLVRYPTTGADMTRPWQQWPMVAGHVTGRCDTGDWCVALEPDQPQVAAATTFVRAAEQMQLVSVSGWGVTVARGEVL